MKTAICDMLKIDLPIVAFSHCRDVVAEVSKAGGCGVLGAALMSPEELDVELSWIDEQVNGKPYGVDLIVPNAFKGKNAGAHVAPEDVEIPQDVIEFVNEILRSHDMDPDQIPRRRCIGRDTVGGVRRRHLEVALKHPLALIANALGTPPPIMLERGKEAGVPVGALVGTKKHAEAQVLAGVDFIVASGTEAGGHTGEIGTMVLVPEIVQHLATSAAMSRARRRRHRDRGSGCRLDRARRSGRMDGIGLADDPRGRDRSLHQGTASCCLSGDTVRSVFRTGKPSRQLRSEWHTAWERAGGPDALRCPSWATSVNRRYGAQTPSRPTATRAPALSTYWVGQGVGLMRTAKSTRQVMADMVDEYMTAVERIMASVEE